MYLRRAVRIASSPVEVTRCRSYRSLAASSTPLHAKTQQGFLEESHRGFSSKRTSGQFEWLEKVEHAVRAVEAGVDFVIAQGSEGGGHTGTIASSVLIPSVVDAVRGRVPVVTAGGIYDGRGLAASMMYGAAGVWVGTWYPSLATTPLECCAARTQVRDFYSHTSSNAPSVQGIYCKRVEVVIP